MTQSQIVLDSPATALRPGRAVIINRTDSPALAYATTVMTVSSDGTHVLLAEPPPEGSEVANIEIAANVVGEGEGWLTELSTTELKSLFALRKDAVGD